MQSPFFLTWLTLTSHQPYNTCAYCTQGAVYNRQYFTRRIGTDGLLHRLYKRRKQTKWKQHTVILKIMTRPPYKRMPILGIVVRLSTEHIIDVLI
jgi:hypothetical protein